MKILKKNLRIPQEIRRPRQRQGGARQRRHYNQTGARNDESKQQEPESGKLRKEDSKEKEHASKVAAIEKRDEMGRKKADVRQRRLEGAKGQEQEQEGREKERQKQKDS